MSQKHYFFSSCIACILTSVLSTPAFAGSLIVQLDERFSEATVHAALLTEHASDWTAEPVAITSSQSATLVFEDIPAGRYAIQLFADHNANGRLDLSPRGIPLEPVGFSNNPSLLYGTPSVAQCVFHHSGGHTPLQIRLVSTSVRQQKEIN
ncbi:MAG: DUF2141 domain-containing protein [Pseudomonas sp.]|jgi:uncharacterized protein (DUF2141 family)|nr:DUF2141 domain-containing protein [Pseudomonas sp.]